MKLSFREMVLIRNYLRSRKAYENVNVPLSAVIWEPYMQTLLTKINDELEALS